MSAELNTSAQRVLFLTTAPLGTQETANFHNSSVYHELVRRGVAASVRSWRDTEWTAEKLDEFTHVTFLSCLNYVYFIDSFYDFLEKYCVRAQAKSPNLRFLNPPEMIKWNSNKIYLNELQAAGFKVPTTMFLSTFQSPDYLKYALASRTTPGPVVIKPSISASAIGTHLVEDPQALNEADEAYLRFMVDEPRSGSVMLQDFLTEVNTGEYSLIFIGGVYKYAYLTTPPNGDYRAHINTGAKARHVDSDLVPAEALSAGKQFIDYVVNKFAIDRPLPYARVDGVMDSKNNFILMEIELIEPELALDRGDNHNGLDELCKVFMT